MSSGASTAAETAVEAFRRRAWAQASAAFADADRVAPLSADDAERAATSSYLSGGNEWQKWWLRAYDDHVRADQRQRAARCAFWLAFAFLDSGEEARAGGWIGRGRKLIEGQADCAEHGYLLVPDAIARLAERDHTGALALFTRVGEIGEQCGDNSLAVLGCLGRAQALIELGRAGEGLPLLDEVMVAVTVDEVSPMVAGLVFCAAIEVCHTSFDLRRAHEWTAALTQWCDTQPALVPYRGQCLVHRAEVMQLHGDWRSAEEELGRACRTLAGRPAAGDAYYRLGELHRLRGELAQAEDAYRTATRAGREPQPGLALLRLAQGDLATATAAISRLLAETTAPTLRAHVLAPYVEIALAAKDVQSARSAAEELSELSRRLAAPYLEALAAQAAGAVLLAEGDPQAAVDLLRRAATRWRQLDARYEQARARVLVARAYRELGDLDTAEMELHAARAVFHQLGAAGDLAAIAAMTPTRARAAFAPLTAREVDVLTLLAAGNSNRGIAEELFISEKTVARHVSNIFAKLGVGSRSAATAWAYRHGLV